MADQYVDKKRSILAVADVLLDLSESLLNAAQDEIAKGLSPEEFQIAWGELVSLACSGDSVRLVLDRVRQFEESEDRVRRAAARFAAWKERGQSGKEGTNEK